MLERGELLEALVSTLLEILHRVATDMPNLAAITALVSTLLEILPEFSRSRHHGVFMYPFQPFLRFYTWSSKPPRP